MMIYIIVGVVVVAVIIGIFVALKSFSWDESNAVPITDIKEFRPSLKDGSVVSFESKFAATPAQPVSSKPSLSQHLLKENLTVQPLKESPFSQPPSFSETFNSPLVQPVAESEELIKIRQENTDLRTKLDNQIKAAKEKISEIIKEKDELSAALAEELNKKSAPQPNIVEDNAKIQERIQENDELKKSVQVLTQENYALTKQIEDEKSKAIEADEKQKLLNERLNDLEKERLQFNQEIIKKDVDFQSLRSESEAKGKEIAEIRQQITELNSKLEESSALNHSLQTKLQTVNNSREIQISQNEYTFEQLDQEKEKLVFQLKVSELKIEELQKTVDMLRQNFELRNQIDAEKKQVQGQMQERQASEGSMKSAAEEKLEWAVLNLEELKREKERLNQCNAELELRLSKIREHNAQLMKKESMLHYELSKSRAQAIGLEKICMSLKEQLEQSQKTSSIL